MFNIVPQPCQVLTFSCQFIYILLCQPRNTTFRFEKNEYLNQTFIYQEIRALLSHPFNSNNHIYTNSISCTADMELLIIIKCKRYIQGSINQCTYKVNIADGLFKMQYKSTQMDTNKLIDIKLKNVEHGVCLVPQLTIAMGYLCHCL